MNLGNRNMGIHYTKLYFVYVWKFLIKAKTKIIQQEEYISVFLIYLLQVKPYICT